MRRLLDYALLLLGKSLIRLFDGKGALDFRIGDIDADIEETAARYYSGRVQS